MVVDPDDCGGAFPFPPCHRASDPASASTPSCCRFRSVTFLFYLHNVGFMIRSQLLKAGGRTADSPVGEERFQAEKLNIYRNIISRVQMSRSLCLKCHTVYKGSRRRCVKRSSVDNGVLTAGRREGRQIRRLKRFQQLLSCWW